MKCKCGAESTVTDSRPHGKGIRRRRKCLNPECGERWSTLEVRGTFPMDKPAIMREAKRVKAQNRKAAEGQPPSETTR